MKTAAYENHPLWQAMDTLRSAYEGLTPPADPEHRYKRDMVGAFIGYLDQFRDEDGLLVNEAHMNQMSQWVAAMSQQIKALAVEPPNWANLDQAVNSIPQAMSYLGQYFPAATADSATAAAKRASTMHRKALESAAEEFRTEIDGLHRRLQASEQARKEQETAFTEELASLKAKAQESDEQISTHAARLLKQIEDQRTAFETAADERATRFSEEAKQRDDDATSQLQEFDKQAQEARDRLASEADTLLERLREHEATSETLVETTARNAIAGDYGAWAKKQSRAALGWTIAAVVLGVLTAIGLIVALKSAHDDTAQFTLYKISIGLVGLIVAGYCARQAAEHRREERVAKRLHLDLAALEPFLKQVDNADELRAEVARRVFVPQQPETDHSVPTFGFRRGWSIQEIGELFNLFGKHTP